MEYFARKVDGERLLETSFILGLPDPLRFEVVREYTLVTVPSAWEPAYERKALDELEVDVRVRSYRIFGRRSDIVWAYFWRGQTEFEGWEEDGVLQRLEAEVVGPSTLEILEALSVGLKLEVRDEKGSRV